MSEPADKRLVGLIGWPVEHSPSPAMHNAAFEALELDWEYVLLPVEPRKGRLVAAVEELRAMGFAGANVTVPHKESIMDHLDGTSAAARSIGAVNTIRITPAGALMGDNTDYLGFLADLRDHGVDPSGMDALVIGAGGSARAIVHALASSGARRIVILNRTPGRAEGLAESIRGRIRYTILETAPFPDGLTRSIESTRLVVNCTPIGLTDDPADARHFDNIDLGENHVVYDLVYTRATPLLARAARCGATAIAGLGMLVHQGALAFEIWTGLKPPIDLMRSAAVSSSGGQP